MLNSYPANFATECISPSLISRLHAARNPMLPDNNTQDPRASGGPSTSSCPDNQRPSTSTSTNPTQHSSRYSANHNVAHHVAEFGHVENLQHIDSPPNVSDDDDQPAPPVTLRDKLSRRNRMSRLRRRCFHERHLHQYWHNETLYRTEANRSITPDELFLDLVIVGGIAVLGHELRENFKGWREIESFLLLFGALYTSWRNLVLLWNIWGICSDFIDKLGIYVVFTCLIFIALTAHGPFKEGVLPYVAAASFVATSTPCLSSIVFGMREPLLKDGGGKTLYAQCILFLFSSLPYFAAIFVRSDLAARALFWTAFILNSIFAISLSFYTDWITERFQKKDVLVTRLAIAIELMVEKYDVLTMIVLGESVLGILFEGAKYLTADGVRLGSLFGAAAISTALLYSLQTLYNNVDSPIPRGGKHAIRYKKLHGLSWSQLHIPYHASLVIFATGLGIALRDVALPPKYDVGSSSAHLAMTIIHAEAASDGVKIEPDFGRNPRWLFSVGWGASVILSGAIGAFHCPGPRAATRHWRFKIRCLISVALMVGMPFTTLSAVKYVSVYTVVTVFIAVIEYLFVQMDKMGFFRSEATTFTSSSAAITKDSSFEGSDLDSSDDLGDAGGLDLDVGKDVETGNAAAPTQPDVAPVTVDNNPELLPMTDALRDRMRKRHTCRLVKASDKKCALDKNACSVV